MYPAPSRSNRERRLWPRRNQLLRVLVMPDDCGLDEPYGGFVLNTSGGGLRLAVPREDIVEGAVLWVRQPFANPEDAWVVARVCNRVRRDDLWELGCVFPQAPYWEGMRLLS